MEKVRRQWSEAQTTLEELGIQLSVSKLQVSELQEKVHAKDTTAVSGIGANSDPGGGVWTPDNMTSKCKGCNREFSITRRKVNVFHMVTVQALIDSIIYLILASLPELWWNILQQLLGATSSSAQRSRPNW